MREEQLGRREAKEKELRINKNDGGFKKTPSSTDEQCEIFLLDNNKTFVDS